MPLRTDEIEEVRKIVTDEIMRAIANLKRDIKPVQIPVVNEEKKIEGKSDKGGTK